MTPAPTCENDFSTTGLYDLDCTHFDHYPSYCGYYDDEDFTASLQCCGCGGFLGKTLAPTISLAPSTSAPSSAPTIFSSTSLAGYALATNVRRHARIDLDMQQLDDLKYYNTAWLEDAMLIYANGDHSVDDSGEIRTLK